MGLARAHRVVFSALVVAGLFSAPVAAVARAGGGGGGGGGGVGSLIFLPFVILYSILVTAIAVWRNQRSRALMRQLRRLDPAWDIESINARVELTYFKVQQAWSERNPDIARDYLSPQLYSKHKLQTDAMIQQHRRNVLERVNLVDSQVVGVHDFCDDRKDRIWVWIKGSMVDYIVDDRTGEVVSGERDKPESFTELWAFVRGEGGWVLDEISQNASAIELVGLPCGSGASA